MSGNVCPAQLPIFTSGVPSDVPRTHTPEREDGAVIVYHLVLHGLRDTVRLVAVCEKCGCLFRLTEEEA